MRSQEFKYGLKVGQHIVDSTESVSRILESLNLSADLENSSDFCTGLDNTALNCTTCGWWHDPDEMDLVDDEYVCIDCREMG